MTAAKAKNTTSLVPIDPLAADFRNFLYKVWKHLNLPVPTEVQYDIAHFLQHGPRRSIIQAFRGVGKSWVTSAFVCWLLYCNPQLNILVVSASKIRADEFSTFTLRLIKEMPELAHLIPGPDQRESKIAFDVGPARASHAPSVKSVGITGQMAGSRADIIIGDDIEVPNNSETEALRDKLSEAVKEFDAILKPGGRVIYLGTPQTEQSLYVKLLDRGYTTRIWCARYPDFARLARYGARLAPMIAQRLAANDNLVGQPVDPVRFPESELQEREASYGRSGFALQFMLDTSLSDLERFPLRVSDFIVMGLNPDQAPTDLIWAASPEYVITNLPNVAMSGDKFYRPAVISKEWQPYTGSVMFIDPSGRGKDETGYAVVKTLNSRLFLTAAGGLTGGYSDEALTAILKVAKTQKVTLILVEPNFGDGMFAQMLRAKARLLYPQCGIDDAPWAKSAKEARIIDTLEPVLNQHRLVVCSSVIENDYRSVENLQGEDASRRRLIYQLTRITKDRGALAKDDRIDALAGAIAHWLEFLSRNTMMEAKQHRDDLLYADLEAFMNDAVAGGAVRGAPSWLRQR